MWANDTNYTVIKNGIVVVSGTGPAIRVDGNKLVIRDGPQESKPLILTRAEASRKLRHVIVCGREGGFVTFAALRWLRDTCVAFSQLDYNGGVIIASGPRGPDQPARRRAQALVCSSVIPQASVASPAKSSGLSFADRRKWRGCLGQPRQARRSTILQWRLRARRMGARRWPSNPGPHRCTGNCGRICR